MEDLNELMESVTGRLGLVARSDVVVGTPIQVGEVTVVPLSRVSVGFGVVGGEGEGEGKARLIKKARAGGGKGGMGGTGGGARVRPVGAAIFWEGGVDVLPIPDRLGVLDKIFERVPEIIDMVKDVVTRQVKDAEK